MLLASYLLTNTKLPIMLFEERTGASWDDVHTVPYMWRGKQWVSDENETSIIEKVVPVPCLIFRTGLFKYLFLYR